MAKTSKYGTCALCGLNGELKESHIVPKFVGKKLKSTSSTGYLRNTGNPNVPIQDIEKEYLLCTECEERFSREEKYFANNFFNPHIVNNEQSFEYDERLYYFITSVNWRELYVDLRAMEKTGQASNEIYIELLNNERIMREYLNGRRDNIKPIENHLFFFGDIDSEQNAMLSKEYGIDYNKIIHRKIANRTFYNESSGMLYTIASMMGVMAISIYQKCEHDEWINTEVLNNSGRIHAGSQIVRSDIKFLFDSWVAEAKRAFDDMSPKQKKLIENRKKD